MGPRVLLNAGPVSPARPHLPPFAEALRSLGARECLLAHAFRVADAATRTETAASRRAGA